MTKPTIQQISIDTTTIIDRLNAAGVGEVIAYEALSALIGRDVRGNARGNLRTAILQQEREGRVFGTIPTVGVKLLPDVELVGEGERGVRKILRAAGRTIRKLTSFRDFNSLPTTDRARVLAQQSVLGAVHSFTKSSTVKRIASGLTAEQKALPAGKTIELFKGE